MSFEHDYRWNNGFIPTKLIVMLLMLSNNLTHFPTYLSFFVDHIPLVVDNRNTRSDTGSNSVRRVIPRFLGLGYGRGFLGFFVSAIRSMELLQTRSAQRGSANARQNKSEYEQLNSIQLKRNRSLIISRLSLRSQRCKVPTLQRSQEVYPRAEPLLHRLLILSFYSPSTTRKDSLSKDFRCCCTKHDEGLLLVYPERQHNRSCCGYPGAANSLSPQCKHHQAKPEKEL